jgi:hypothetical protein
LANTEEINSLLMGVARFASTETLLWYLFEVQGNNDAVEEAKREEGMERNPGLTQERIIFWSGIYNIYK